MLTADQNFRLLEEIEANRQFLLMAFQQNPKLLEGAEARIQQIVGMDAPHGHDNRLSSVLRPPSSERGISLIELVMFIVIVSIALVGILAVMNKVTSHSADPLIRKQSLAIAESLLEEVELMPFTFCDPDDASATTATSAVVGGTGCATTSEVIGTEGTEGRYTPPVPPATLPFDNVSDYHGFNMAGTISDVTNTAVPNLGGYGARITVGQSGIPAVGAVSAIPATEALGITVTVTGPDNIPVVLDGYRTRYSPRAVP